MVNLQRLTVDLLPEQSPGKTWIHAKDVRTHKCTTERRPHGVTHLLRRNLRMTSSHLTKVLWQPIMWMWVILWIHLMRCNFIIYRLTKPNCFIKRHPSTNPILDCLHRFIHFFSNCGWTVFLYHLRNHAMDTKPSV